MLPQNSISLTKLQTHDQTLYLLKMEGLVLTNTQQITPHKQKNITKKYHETTQ